MELVCHCIETCSSPGMTTFRQKLAKIVCRFGIHKLLRTFIVIASVSLLLTGLVNFLAAKRSHLDTLHDDQRHDDQLTAAKGNTDRSPNSAAHKTIDSVAVENVPRRTINKTICDEECSRLGQLVDSWPLDRPRAAIILLLQRKSLPVFTRSAAIFHTNFNEKFRYPIIVFHEADLDAETERNQLRAAVPDSKLVFFQRVAFDIPSFLNKSAVPKKICFKTIGYRHMCRFHAKTVYEEPILAKLRYVWRLDDDSYIVRAVTYDVFRLMADRRLRYGYATVVSDYGPCIVGLWPAINQYLTDRKLRRRFRWPRGRIFWNNFEISDLEMWRSSEYVDYINYIDQTGGIYYRRWGDATIKTIAVTLFASRNETHHFKDIAYKHGKRIKV